MTPNQGVGAKNMPSRLAFPAVAATTTTGPGGIWQKSPGLRYLFAQNSGRLLLGPRVMQINELCEGYESGEVHNN
jgi:hypothetical protein